MRHTTAWRLQKVKPLAAIAVSTINERPQIVGTRRFAKDDLIRVIDESGECYLFHRRQLALVDLPENVRRRLPAIQRAT